MLLPLRLGRVSDRGTQKGLGFRDLVTRNLHQVSFSVESAVEEADLPFAIHDVIVTPVPGSNKNQIALIRAGSDRFAVIRFGPKRGTRNQEHACNE